VRSFFWECYRVAGRVARRGGGGGGNALPTELIDGKWVVIGQGAATAVAVTTAGAAVRPKARSLPREGDLVCHARPLLDLPPEYGWAPGAILPEGPGGYLGGLGGGYGFPGDFGGLGVVGGVGDFGGPLFGSPLLPAPGPLLDVSGGPGLVGGVVVPSGGEGGPTPVPEPAAVTVFVLALAVLALVRKRA